MDKQQTQQCLVSDKESGQKLFSYLKRRLGRDFPGSGIMRLIRTGQVRVNSRRSKPYDRVFAGDIVRIPPHFPETADDPSRAGSLEIIHENEDFLVLHKPAGVPVHSGTSAGRDNMALRLRKHYAHAGFTPALVHRLDKDTSGLLLAAKSYAWLREIHRIWKKGGVDKIYLAWIHGPWPRGWTRLEHRLVRRHEKMIPSSEGRIALSWVMPVRSHTDYTLVMVRLITGLTHQIRAQLALCGTPVLGDRRYGPKSGSSPGMFLHAYRLSWPGGDFSLPPAWTGDLAVPSGLDMLIPESGKGAGSRHRSCCPAHPRP